MALTASQLPALRAAIDAETDPEFVGYRTNGQTGLMAQWFNQPGAAVVWDSRAKWSGVQDAIDYAKYTPAVANMPTDVAGTNRLLGVLIKLTVQQNMLLGSRDGYLDARDPGVMDALIDTVTGIQSGVGGAVTAPGGASGVNVATAATRNASRAESLYPGTDMTKGTITANVLAWEGQISEYDIGAALALP